jgi:hypothetical protein
LDDEPERVATLVGEKSDYWPSSYPCLECPAKDGRVVQETSIAPDLLAKLRIRDLGSEEYFRALLGLGTPDEDLPTLQNVRVALRSPVKSVKGTDVRATGRCIVTSLELEDGTTLYLGASSHGAVVYRISKPTSYVAKVLQDV